MSLAANALVTREDAKSFMDIDASSDDANLEKVINRVSDAIERWCRRPLRQATYTDLRLRGPYCPELFLRHTPISVTDPISVVVNSLSLTVWRTEADGDPAAKDVVVQGSAESSVFAPDMLYRAYGWDSYSEYVPNNVKLTYTGGWALASIPDDLQEAALEIIKQVWNDQDKGLQDVTTVTLPTGGFTVFAAPFPRRALQLLEPYRRLVVA